MARVHRRVLAVIGALCVAGSIGEAVAQSPDAAAAKVDVVGERVAAFAICGPDSFIYAEAGTPEQDGRVAVNRHEVEVKAAPGRIEARPLWQEFVQRDDIFRLSGGTTCDSRHRLIGLRFGSLFKLKSFAGDLIAEVAADAQLELGVDLGPGASGS